MGYTDPVRKKHPDKALTALKIRNTTKPGRYADGNGLYLVVDPSGAKRWVLRIVIHGKRRDIGLGGIKTTTLAEARAIAVAMRSEARAGGDPLETRLKARRVVTTFAEAAVKVHEEHSPTWKNSKHRQQWINTLKQYVFPALGNMAINKINTPDILAALSPIWLTKPETARRVRQRIRTVFDWAKAAGYIDGENPTIGVTKGLPKQPKNSSHFDALPYCQVGDFIRDLRNGSSNEIVKLAFEFMILTAARTGEVHGATWEEIDFDNRAWNIPSERMKAGKAHRVPLSHRCVEILRFSKQLNGDNAFIFHGQNLSKPLSNMAFLMIIRRMGLPVTAHGFRSAFRDWSAEQTSFPRELCEKALAHTIANKTESAYQRGDLFEKRRELMSGWSRYVSK